MGWLGLGWQPTARSRGALADGAGWRRPIDSGYPAAREGEEIDQEQIGVEGGPILGSKEGSPHRSWADHGIGGRAGELDGDSVACRLRVLLTGRRGVVRWWGPHGVVAGLEEDRRQRCAWSRSR
jgi:hypothetical protein